MPEFEIVTIRRSMVQPFHSPVSADFDVVVDVKSVVEVNELSTMDEEVGREGEKKGHKFVAEGRSYGQSVRGGGRFGE